MKNFKLSIAWLAMFALIFTSCSKEEAGPTIEDQELIQLSFGSIMNDFNNQNKQADPGECREGTPSYVWIGITDSDGNYIGDDGGTTVVNLIEVGLKWNTSLEVWETTYSDELALPAGDYELQHFIVYDTNDQVLWVAPRLEGAFGDSVANPLPQDIVLAAGTKPYITVDVLCYISRSEDAYGYLFFDIRLTEVENSYCVFVNFCDDTTGREYPANFRFDIWTDGYEGSNLLVSGVNTVDMSGEWPAASVLCLALPEIVGADLYARVTVLDDGQAYTPGVGDVYDFRISQDDIEAQELQTPRYDHVRINCGEDPGNGGGGNGGGGEDEVCTIDPACELIISGTLDENCFFTVLEGEVDGWLKIDNAGDLVDLNLQVDFPIDGLADVADVSVTVNNGDLSISVDTPYEAQDRITGYAVEVRPSTTGGAMNSTCWESECSNVVNEAQLGMIDLGDYSGFDYSYPFYLKIDAIFCFTPDVIPE